MSSRLDSLTIGEVRELAALMGHHAKTHPFVVGRAYFIRTVTMHIIGRVDRVDGDFLTLTDAAWIADSGRFNEALKNGTLNEVEPFVLPAMVNMIAITDATEWPHHIPIGVM